MKYHEEIKNSFSSKYLDLWLSNVSLIVIGNQTQTLKVQPKKLKNLAMLITNRRRLILI
jgi:hypothetical protein